MTDYVIPEEKLRNKASDDHITHFSTGIVFANDGKILIVRREPNDYLGGFFELPGGGVDPGENFDEAIRREALEETGLIVDNVLTKLPGFDYSTPSKPKVRQLNFLVDAKNHEIKLSSEHDKFMWIDESSINNLKTTGPMAKCLKDAFKALKNK